MHVLRERLEQQHTELYASLMRSWEIALDQWLPALAATSASFNSYPHLRNLESYLDDVIIGFENLQSSNRRLDMKPIELYLILAAILFHDIGRIRDDDRHGHGWSSKEIIERRWAELGIPSAEIAHSLATICLYHEPDKDPGPDKQRSDRRQLEPELRNTVIDPYGEIRQLAIASLLALVDQIDGAYCRVAPAYLKNYAELDPVGAFRRAVSGVYVDSRNRMIRTVLGNSLRLTDEDKDELRRMDEQRITDELGDNASENRKARKREILDRESGLYSRETEPDFSKEKARKAEWEKLDSAGIDYKQGPAILDVLNCLLENCADWQVEPQQKLPLIPHVIEPPKDESWRKDEYWPSGFTGREYLVARALLKVERKTHAGQGGKRLPRKGYWAPQHVLAAIMGNVRENAETLEDLKANLAAVGIPILAWVMEYKEHLYNECGQETYEPIFDEDYLLRIAEGMYELSRRTFGVSEFTYSTLAAQIRDPVVERVATAVRRIAIISEPLRKENCSRKKNGDGAARFGDSTWSWQVDIPKGERCSFVTLADIRKAMTGLGRPAFENTR